jgi:hypothetical protein
MRTFFLLGLGYFVALFSGSAQAQQRLRAGQLEVWFNAQGWPEAARLGRERVRFRAETAIEGATPRLLGVERLAADRLRVRRQWQTPDGRGCTSVETFALEKQALAWTWDLTGTGTGSWSAELETRVALDGTRTHWLPWGDPRPDAPASATSEAETRRLLDGARPTAGLPATDWTDPLVPQPPRDRLLWYGGPVFGSPRPDGGRSEAVYYNPLQARNVVSVPLAVLLGERTGLSLGIAPDDLGIEALFRTTAQGEVRFARVHNRIGPDRPRRFTSYLFFHGPHWREGMGAYTRQFPDAFRPVLDAVQDFGGTGAYSWRTAELDTAKLRRMAFRTNWDAFFPFLYMGQFLPPLPDSATWLGWRGIPVSFASIDRSYARLQRAGFHALSYFNITEYGNYVVPRREYVPRRGDFRTPWVNANRLLHDSLEAAVVYWPTDTTRTNFVYTYERSIVVDPATPVYRGFLLEQARRHLERLPHFEGFAIDRMDWTRLYNPRADDGLTWVKNAPARSLHTSWNEVLDSLHRLLHPAGKVIFVNNHVKRLEEHRYVDGVFDEFGYGGASLNANAFLCVQKPLIGWVSHRDQLFPAGDAFMQRFLHLGAFPMAPFAANDHSLLPDPETEQLYLDYGPLLDALRGKRWVFDARAEVPDGPARANLFAVPDGYVLPVTFGGAAESVPVTLRGLPDLARYRITCHWPGDRPPIPLTPRGQTLTVPLHRGTALLRFTRLSAPE